MRSRRSPLVLLGGAAALFVAVGCKGRGRAAVEMSAASSEPAPAALASAPSKAARALAPPWFLGVFVGQYEASLAPVEVKAGALREWKSDDGKLSSGAGKLTLQIDADGNVQGAGEGALGASSATGKVEEDTLRVQFVPTDAAGFHGVLVASRDGDGFKGSLQASTADSLRVRRATVEFKKLVN